MEGGELSYDRLKGRVRLRFTIITTFQGVMEGLLNRLTGRHKGWKSTSQSTGCTSNISFRLDDGTLYFSHFILETITCGEDPSGFYTLVAAGYAHKVEYSVKNRTQYYVLGGGYKCCGILIAVPLGDDVCERCDEPMHVIYGLDPQRYLCVGHSTLTPVNPPPVMERKMIEGKLYYIIPGGLLP